MPDQFEVFLSYNREDEAWVSQLKTALEAAGLRVWRDKESIRPGDVFPNAIAQGLRDSASICFVISHRSVESKWVNEEYNRALVLAVENGKRIIGLRLDDAPLPDFLSIRHAVDFRDPKQFAEGVRQLRWGVTGVLPLPSPVAGAVALAPSPLQAGECEAKPVAEMTWLRSTIQSTERAMRQINIVRLSALGMGIFFAGGWLVAAGLQAGVWAIGTPLVTWLCAWGLTRQEERANDAQLRRWSVFRDALEGCAIDEHPHPACRDVRDKFWKEVTKLLSPAQKEPVT